MRTVASERMHDCEHHILDHEPVEIAGNDDWAVVLIGPCAVKGCDCQGEHR